MPDVRVIEGDCLAILPTLEAGSFDAVITDPPYPCIKRAYGYWTEEEWWEMMRPCVRECMRLLKPTGSAVFILQPNSEKVGRMRPWLFDFQAWVCREFGMVQDAWWWNIAALPLAGSPTRGLMRPSLRACVWLGPPDCYRDQQSVLWGRGEWHKTASAAARMGTVTHPSGRQVDHAAMVGGSLNGVTPFNVLPVANNHQKPGDGGGDYGHGAGTPLPLLRWWARYICPPGGTILDPFAGSGTLGVAALREGRSAVLIEKEPAYGEIIRQRLGAERADCPLFPVTVSS